jgi:transcriptional regulator with XRE-family HTH domain
VYFLESARVSTRAIAPQKAFGSRIKELRLLAGMTQEDLAERCGLFRTYMSRIETGQANPTLTMIHALATSLAVTPGSLFDPAGDPPEEAVPAPRKPRPSRGRVR